MPKKPSNKKSGKVERAQRGAGTSREALLVKAAPPIEPGAVACTVPQAARLLNLPLSAVYEHLSTRGGWIPAVRTGAQTVRIPLALLTVALEKRAKASAKVGAA